jgi:hypothetical protein
MRKPSAEEKKADAFINGADRAVEEPSKTVVNTRFDTALLGRIDADARRHGVSRTAWLHFAAIEMLKRAQD